MSSGFKISGVEELQAAFREVLAQAPDRVEDQAMKMARKLRKNTRERTPEQSGRLRKGYKIEEPQRLADGFKVELYNKEPYFHLVERGHREVDPVTRQEFGFVPGAFMLEQSVVELDDEAPEELEKWLNKLYKELHK
jgi:hypothetical protein